MRKSDLAALILIILLILFLGKLRNNETKNQEYLKEYGRLTNGIVVDFTYLKSRKFMEYEYKVMGKPYRGSEEYENRYSEINIGLDKNRIMYDPFDEYTQGYSGYLSMNVGTSFYYKPIVIDIRYKDGKIMSGSKRKHNLRNIYFQFGIAL